MKTQHRQSTAKRKPQKSGKRAENKERTRKAILRAALDLFDKQGFYRATTRSICRKAGIAEGTLFNYFRTKEDLALCFFEEELADLTDWFRREKRLRQAPLPEKLFAIIHQHLERIGPHESFIGAVYLRALHPASKLNLLSLESLALLDRCLNLASSFLKRGGWEW